MTSDPSYMPVPSAHGMPKIMPDKKTCLVRRLCSVNYIVLWTENVCVYTGSLPAFVWLCVSASLCVCTYVFNSIEFNFIYIAP